MLLEVFNLGNIFFRVNDAGRMPAFPGLLILTGGFLHETENDQRPETHFIDGGVKI
jgi:hypothetical protein